VPTRAAEETPHDGARPPSAAVPGAQQNAGQPAPQIQQAGEPTVDVLAKKTQSYSQEMEDLMSKRASAPAKPQPSAQESAVEWMKPRQAAADTTGSQPAMKSTPATNKPIVTPALDTTNHSTAVVEKSTDVNLPASNSPQMATIEPAKPPAATGGSIDSFDSKLSKRVKDYPRDISAHLDYQLWLFLRDQSVPQLQTLSSLPTEDREIIAALMDALTNFRSAVRAENNMLLSRKIRPLADLAERLHAQADLAIPKVALCSSVMGYGQYEAMEPRFVANGKEPQAILYCEIENFSAQLVPGDPQQQQWASELRLESVLYSDNSSQVLKIWADKPETVRDVSRNRRHDFFLRKRIALPKMLPLGRYLLKVSITDTQSNRIAETTLPIDMVAQ
jgi:hypothetical protein